MARDLKRGLIAVEKEDFNSGWSLSIYSDKASQQIAFRIALPQYIRIMAWNNGELFLLYDSGATGVWREDAKLRRWPGPRVHSDLSLFGRLGTFVHGHCKSLWRMAEALGKEARNDPEMKATLEARAKVTLSTNPGKLALLCATCNWINSPFIEWRAGEAGFNNIRADVVPVGKGFSGALLAGRRLLLCRFDKEGEALSVVRTELPSAIGHVVFVQFGLGDSRIYVGSVRVKDSKIAEAEIENGNTLWVYSRIEKRWWRAATKWGMCQFFVK